MPRLTAFCRSDPSVRFIDLAIFFTGVLAFECARRSRTSAFVYSMRVRFFFVFFATFLAILTPMFVDFSGRQKASDNCLLAFIAILQKWKVANSDPLRMFVSNTAQIPVGNNLANSTSLGASCPAKKILVNLKFCTG